MNDILIVILIVLLLAILFLVWFLYAMGHPRPGEPRFIYQFRRHPSAIPEYLALFARGLFHPHMFNTGSTRQERAQALPGDDLLPHPKLQETRAATIDIPAEDLWPWIAQMGDARGGWYWWTPCEVFPEYARYVISTNEVLDQFQTLNVGDKLSDGGPYVTDERGNWVVRSIAPNQHLVLFAGRQVTGGSDYDPADVKPTGLWFVSSWAFVLQPITPQQTRLLVRVRAMAGPAWLIPALRVILKGDTVAHHSMLERIKSRAEAYYHRQKSPSLARLQI